MTDIYTGMARADFNTLRTLWAHANLSRQNKLRIFAACVLSKLLYCIFTMQLNTGERRRLDAFQAWCLRKIAGIPASFYSRVANSTVLNICGQRRLSEQVAHQQMIYMGTLERRQAEDPTRATLFEDSTLAIRNPVGRRRQGRPRHRWGVMVMNNCLKAAGSPGQLVAHFRPEDGAAGAWRSVVRSWHLP